MGDTLLPGFYDSVEHSVGYTLEGVLADTTEDQVEGLFALV